MSIVGEGQGEGEISSVILRYEVPKNLVAERSEGSSPYYLFCIWNFGKQSLDKIETSLNSLYNNLLSPAIMLTVPALPIRRGDRVVEGNGLENRRCASNRRFESCPLRHPPPLSFPRKRESIRRPARKYHRLLKCISRFLCLSLV